ncbi:MAG: hypothetical protein SOX46_01570 [Clostridiaceae bacterium]|nr:hypothetical protein [Clostridiaceae bacterium]
MVCCTNAAQSLKCTEGAIYQGREADSDVTRKLKQTDIVPGALRKGLLTGMK